MILTMLRGSTDLSSWLFLAGILCCCSCQSALSSFENKTEQTDSRPRVFSPRMDYDEWTPLGRGDPLKNNPTFDYVPPVLDRVQYWLDTHTTEPSTKRDILVLGVTAKKTSPKIPEQFLKFVDAPKFTRTNQDTSYRNDFTGSSGAEPPKVVRTTNFRNGPIDYRNQNRIQSLPASYYPSPYYNQKTKPYAMMLPPPLIQKSVSDSSNAFNGGGVSKDKVLGYVEPTQQFSTQTEEGPVLQDAQYYALPSKNYNQLSPSSLPGRLQPQNPPKAPSKGLMVSQIETIKSVYTPPSQQPTKSKFDSTTTSSVSFEKSNLIYQSTQTLSGGWLGNNGPTATSLVPETYQSTWHAPNDSHDQYEIDHHASGSSNHEVVIGQNANIIVDGDTNENEEVVLGQKEIGLSEGPPPTTVHLVQPITNQSTEKESNEGDSVTSQSSEKMHIVVANSPASNIDIDIHAAKKGPVAVVMPTNYIDKKVNATLENSEAPTPLPIASESSMTTDVEKSTQNTFKTQSQPLKNSVTSLPVFEEHHSSPFAAPNNMMTNHHQVPQNQASAVPPPRHAPNNPIHSFASPPMQPMMHSQPRPSHGMMHFIGSMRPGVGFRSPGSISMSHVSPPMAHMYGPLMKPMMGHVGTMMAMDQSHQRPPQVQPFPVSFTNPPGPLTLTSQPGLPENPTFDHHRSRLPDMTTLITTPTPFVPTVSADNEPIPITNAEKQDNPATNQSSLVKILSDEEDVERKRSTTVSPVSSTNPPQTTTVSSLTTDPIFSHYKQPAKPIRGPMYLIIQGHSKVKTYKPTVNKHGVPVVRNEYLESLTEKPLSKFEQFIKENTKNGNGNTAGKKKSEEKPRNEKIGQPRVQQENLMSLVECGLGSFTVSPSSSGTEEEHQANSVTTIEVNGN